MTYSVEMKLPLIHLIIISHIVEETLSINCDYKKVIQIKIPNFLFYIKDGNNKRYLNFFNSAVFYDCKNIGIIMEINKVRNCVFNIFHEVISASTILISLGNIDDMNLKINDSDFDDTLDKLHDLREKILYMIGFEKLVREEKVEENNIEYIFDDNNWL